MASLGTTRLLFFKRKSKKKNSEKASPGNVGITQYPTCTLYVLKQLFISRKEIESFLEAVKVVAQLVMK